MQLSTVFFALAAASGGYAASQTVTVGDSNQLAFGPSQINNVQTGDVITFEFRSKNHSVTQSTFSNPCSPLANGANSNFQPASTSPFPQFNYTVQNASAPLWFYCAQTNPVNHCQSGMVFAINPTADKSFDAFQAAANASGSAPGASSVAPSGAPPFSSPTTAGAGAASASPTDNGAARMGASASGILALAGLVAGLML